MEKDLKIALALKGWSKTSLAQRWSVKERQIANILNKPKQKDRDALMGLPAYEFKINDYEPIIRLALYDEYNNKSYKRAYTGFNKDNNTVDGIPSLLIKKPLEELVFHIIVESHESLALFLQYRRGIQASCESPKNEVCFYLRFIEENVFDTYPDFMKALYEKSHSEKN